MAARGGSPLGNSVHDLRWPAVAAAGQGRCGGSRVAGHNHPLGVTQPRPPRGDGGLGRDDRRSAATDGRDPRMTMPVKADVDEATRDALSGLSEGDVDVLEAGLHLREEWQEASGLDPRAFALTKVAALVAMDAPPASYVWQVANALDAGRHAAGDPRRAARHRAAGRDAQGHCGGPGDHGLARPVTPGTAVVARAAAGRRRGRARRPAPAAGSAAAVRKGST